MPVFNLPGTQPAYNTGANTGNYLAKAADAAANFACGLYKNFPGAVIGNPTDSFRRGLLDSLCNGRNPGLPSPPAQQFTGGQCNCILYNVTYTYTRADGTVPGTFTGSYLAPVRGLRVKKETTSGGTPIDVVYVVGSSCTNGVATEREFRGSQSPAGIKDVRITNIVRADGKADNCGNPQPDYPPESYAPPSLYDRGSGGITYNDGASITVPLVYAPISPQFNLNPNFNVDVGGLTFNFNLGGVDINVGSQNGSPASPRNPFNDTSDDFNRIENIIRGGNPASNLGDITGKIDGIQGTLNTQGGTLNNISNGVNNLGDILGDIGGDINDIGGDIGDIGGGIDDIKKGIDDLKKGRNDSPPPDEDPGLDKTEDPVPKDGDSKEVDRLEYVCIHLTTLPDRMQAGAGAPNVYYAGWLEFKANNCCLPRQPIHFIDSIFKAPDGASAYAFTLTNGAKGTVKVYTRKVPVT